MRRPRQTAGESARQRGGPLRRLATAIDDPLAELGRALTKVPAGGFQLRSDLDLYPRPHYAYCVRQAAQLAHRLGLPAVSVAEIGVAGGRGLVEMERMAALAEGEFGIRVEVYGFDRVEGLPQPLDYRDLPYHWQSGDFKMDLDRLKERLSFSELVLGDLLETVPVFNRRRDVAPLGFLAIDVDFFSSANDGLRLFANDFCNLMPRALIYLDDIVGEDYVLHNDYVGELAAVSDFNRSQQYRKIAKVNGLVHKRIRKAAWCDSIFAFHCFDHPQYNTYIGPSSEEQQRRLDGTNSGPVHPPSSLKRIALAMRPPQ